MPSRFWQNLGLAAEHGLHFRFPGELKTPSSSSSGYSSPSGRDSSSFVKRKWETLVALRDQSWKQLTRTIMNLYAQRTHGTYVVNKGSALLWQFRDADPEFGWLQSKELEDHLTTVLKPFSVEILRGSGSADGDGGYIEVRPGGVNKGAFVSGILSRQVEMGLMPDFILAMGDEESDEMMFEAVKEFSRGVKGEEPGTPDTAAVTAQGAQNSPGRRRGSYQVGATAAVLIKSAAAELKRQQEEADETDSLQPASALMGAHPSSAPADVTTISLMAGLGKHAGEEKTPGGGPRGSGMLSQDSGFLDMGGAVRGRSQSIAEPERHFRQKSGTERWRGGIPGVGGSGGVAIGASPLGVQCFTCTVGKKPSQAATYVNDIDEVLELLRGLVKVSSSVARNYSTSHLSDMRTGGAGGSANYDDLSLISAQFHAEGSGGRDASGQSVMPLGQGGGLAVGGMTGMMKSLSVVVMPTHLLPMRSAPTAPGTMSAYFEQIEEGEEEGEGGIFF